MTAAVRIDPIGKTVPDGEVIKSYELASKQADVVAGGVPNRNVANQNVAATSKCDRLGAAGLGIFTVDLSVSDNGNVFKTVPYNQGNVEV